MYVAAFFLTRTWVSITLGKLRMYSVRVYYFSANPTANRVLYGFFYPIVIIAGYPIGDGNRLTADYRARINGPYYSAEVEELQLEEFD